MKNRAALTAAAALMLASLSNVPEAKAPQRVSAPAGSPGAVGAGAVVQQYCVGCHNERLKSGGLVLDGLDMTAIGNDAAVWEKVVRKLRTGAMPPQGARHPDESTARQLITFLESELDRAAGAHPDPGAPLAHRLNRAEYGNAIRDLLALDVAPSDLLPPDDSAYGFDNIADVLGLSPLLVERYVAAAESISALAVGELDVPPGSETYRVRQDQSQDQHIEGLPLGTVGGLGVRHTFPVDGEYEFRIRLLQNNIDLFVGMERPYQLEVAVDGKRVLLDTVGGDKDARILKAGERNDSVTGPRVDARLLVRVPVQAGRHLVTAAFLQRRGVDTDRLEPFVRTTTSPYKSIGVPHVRELIVTGPFNATGLGDTPSRRRIFSCRPATATVAAELPCARQILSTLARRAYRRPVDAGDMRPVMAFYETGRREGSFETGIQLGLQRILSSPNFVLRVESERASGASGRVRPLNDFELASRLSFFLWSSIPDDVLLDVASRRQLSTPQGLERQVRRMLADSRAAALVENFAGQWLQLRNLRNIVPDPEEFPDFDHQLREAFQRETELLFTSVMQEDRGILDLLTADYTYVNERLARHYGMPYVAGSHFRRVPVREEARRGVLGHGSVLTVTSHADRTAPVLRGKWILDNLLGTPPPPPPPDVNTDLPVTAEGQKPPTMRQLMEVHRANPVCASCHKLMDPIGLALEHFDAIGALRTRETGGPIDATTQLFDGTQVDGAVELRRALFKRPEVIVTTFTEKLLTYAVGRGLQPSDMPAVRRIVRDAAGTNYRFSSIVTGVVNTLQFRMRRSEPAGASAMPRIAAGDGRPDGPNTARR